MPEDMADAAMFGAFLAAIALAVIVQLSVIHREPGDRFRYPDSLSVSTPVLILLSNATWLCVKCKGLAAGSDNTRRSLDLCLENHAVSPVKTGTAAKTVDVCAASKTLAAEALNREAAATTVASSALAMGALSAMLIVYTVLREAGMPGQASAPKDDNAPYNSEGDDTAPGAGTGTGSDPADVAAWAVLVASVSVAVFQLFAYTDVYKQFRDIEGYVFDSSRLTALDPVDVGVLLLGLVVPVAGAWLGLWRFRTLHPSSLPHCQGRCRVIGAVVVSIWFVLLPTIAQQWLAHTLSARPSTRVLLWLIFSCAAWSGSGFSVILLVLRRRLVPHPRAPQQRRVYDLRDGDRLDGAPPGRPHRRIPWPDRPGLGRHARGFGQRVLRWSDRQ